MISARDFLYEAHRVPLYDETSGEQIGVSFVHTSVPDDVVPGESGAVRGAVRSVLRLVKTSDNTTRYARQHGYDAFVCMSVHSRPYSNSQLHAALTHRAHTCTIATRLRVDDTCGVSHPPPPASPPPLLRVVRMHRYRYGATPGALTRWS